MNSPPAFKMLEFSTNSGTSAKRGRSYGGSAKMKSNELGVADERKRKTSPRMRRRFFSPKVSAVLAIKRCCMADFSTEVTWAASRESSSNVIAPVPANRSRAWIPSMSMMFSMTLNIFSRAKSVVGRAVMFEGTVKRRRPYFPRIIRMMEELEVGMELELLILRRENAMWGMEAGKARQCMALALCLMSPARKGNRRIGQR